MTRKRLLKKRRQDARASLFAYYAALGGYKSTVLGGAPLPVQRQVRRKFRRDKRLYLIFCASLTLLAQKAQDHYLEYNPFVKLKRITHFGSFKVKP